MMRGPIRAISDAIRDLIWLPEPRPISAPVRVRRAIRIRERRAPLSCLAHSPAGRRRSPASAHSLAPPGDHCNGGGALTRERRDIVSDGESCDRAAYSVMTFGTRTGRIDGRSGSLTTAG